jgi:hypothetical protein
MRLPITAGWDTAQDRIRVCSDASSTEMQCLRPLRQPGPLTLTRSWLNKVRTAVALMASIIVGHGGWTSNYSGSFLKWQWPVREWHGAFQMTLELAVSAGCPFTQSYYLLKGPLQEPLGDWHILTHNQWGIKVTESWQINVCLCCWWWWYWNPHLGMLNG